MAYPIFFKVEYVTEIFDLTAPQSAFEFIYQIYNFLSEAKLNNDGLHEPENRLLDAKDSVARKGYPRFSTQKREEMGDTSICSHRPPALEGEQDSFSDQSVLQELTRAGYMLAQPLPEGFTRLTPVSCN